MDWNWLPIISCSLAGLIMVIGSLYLIWKGRITLDKESKTSTKFKLPGGFEVESPVAALLMFLLGVFLLFIPIHYSPLMCPDLAFHKKKPLEMVELRGKVSTDTNIEVYAIVDEQTANAEQTVSLSVPYVSDRRYVVRYINAMGALASDETFLLKEGEKFHDLIGVKETKGAAAAASPTPAIVLEHTESPSAVSEFITR
ncbi:MAG: hypothetical protein ABJA18_02835 [bacterium]